MITVTRGVEPRSLHAQQHAGHGSLSPAVSSARPPSAASSPLPAALWAAKDRFERARHSNKPKEQIGPDKGPPKGPWTHKKRQPVKHYTPEEIEGFNKERGTK